MKHIFKKFFFLFIAIAFVVGVSACGLENIPKDNPTIAFERAEVELVVDETYTLSPSISGISGSDLIEYSFDKDGYLSISGSTITALKVGTVVITAKIKGYDVSAKLSVVIKENNNQTQTGTLATIPSNLQGTYKGDGVSVVVSEHSVMVLTPEDQMNFELYTDDKGIYVVDTDSGVTVKIYVTFNADGTSVTAGDKGTFTRDNNSQTTYSEATVPQDLRNTYVNGNDAITITEHTAQYSSVTGTAMEYTIYYDNNGYFIMFNDSKYYMTITPEQITMSDGTVFAKGTLVVITDKKAEIPMEYRGSYFAYGMELEISIDTLTYKSMNISLTIYVDSDGYYLYSEDEDGQLSKEYIVFGNESLTIDGSTFSKSGNVSSDIPARMPSNLQGTYKYANLPDIVINATTIVLQKGTFTATLYVDAKGYYFYINGSRQDLVFDADGGLVNGALTYTKDNGGNEQPDYTKANLSADLQGKYTGDGVVVMVYADNVSVTDPSGKTMTYSLYEDANGIFFLEDGARIYCSFTSSSVSNKYGTFKKVGGETPTTEPTVANIPEEYQGTYSNNYAVVIVYESSVSVYEKEDGVSMLYIIYIDENGYYITDEGQKIYCTFTSSSVSNMFGTFTKNGSGEQGGESSETPDNTCFYEKKLEVDRVVASDDRLARTILEQYRGAFLSLFGTYKFEMGRQANGYYDILFGDFTISEDGKTAILVVKKEYDAEDNKYYYYEQKNQMRFVISYENGEYVLPIAEEADMTYVLYLKDSTAEPSPSNVPNDPNKIYYYDFDPTSQLTQDQWDNYFLKHGLMNSNFAVEFDGGQYVGNIRYEFAGNIIHLIKPAEDVYYERINLADGGCAYKAYYKNNNGEWVVVDAVFTDEHLENQIGIFPAQFFDVNWNNSTPSFYYAQIIKFYDSYQNEIEVNKYKVYTQDGYITKISYEEYGSVVEFMFKDYNAVSLTLPVESSGGQGQGGIISSDINDYYALLKNKVLTFDKVTNLSGDEKTLAERAFKSATFTIFDNNEFEAKFDYQFNYDDIISDELVLFGTINFTSVNNDGYVVGKALINSYVSNGILFETEENQNIRWYVNDNQLRLSMDDGEYFIYFGISEQTPEHYEKPQPATWPKNEIITYLGKNDLSNETVPDANNFYSIVTNYSDDEMIITVYCNDLTSSLRDYYYCLENNYVYNESFDMYVSSSNKLGIKLESNYSAGLMIITLKPVDITVEPSYAEWPTTTIESWYEMYELENESVPSYDKSLDYAFLGGEFEDQLIVIIVFCENPESAYTEYANNLVRKYNFHFSEQDQCYISESGLLAVELSKDKDEGWFSVGLIYLEPTPWGGLTEEVWNNLFNGNTFYGSESNYSANVHVEYNNGTVAENNYYFDKMDYFEHEHYYYSDETEEEIYSLYEYISVADANYKIYNVYFTTVIVTSDISDSGNNTVSVPSYIRMTLHLVNCGYSNLQYDKDEDCYYVERFVDKTETNVEFTNLKYYFDENYNLTYIELNSVGGSKFSASVEFYDYGETELPEMPTLESNFEEGIDED